MANSDAELIQRTLDGDDTAFGFLVDKYKGAVHALAYRKTGNFHTAEDITQDTFLRAYQKLHTLKDWRHFPGWLYRIAHRFCLMWHRKRRVVPQPLDKVESGHMDALAWVKHTDQQTRQSVRDGLEALPESQRTVLTLHYLGGMTCEEIARFIGTSRGAVLDRLYRARLQLKKEMIPMMEHTLGAFQLPPTFTQQMMNRMPRKSPTTSPEGKPILPWIAATAMLVVALCIGLGQRSMMRFQEPYSFDAPEPAQMVELIDAPIIHLQKTNPALVNRPGNLNPRDGMKGNQSNGTSFSTATIAEAGIGRNDTDWTQTNGPYGGRIKILFRGFDGTLYTIVGPSIFRSRNNGDSWARIYNEVDTRSNVGTPINPSSITEANGLLYASGSMGFCYSNNQGESWQWGSYPRYKNDIAIGAFSVIGSRIYISREKDGVAYSDDYGESWTAIRDGLPVEPPDKLMAVGITLFAKVGDDLFRLKTDETSWTKIANLPEFRFLVAEPKALVIGNNTDLRRSTDEGETWTPMIRELANQDSIIVGVTAFRDSVYVLLNDGKLLRSTDNGRSWVTVETSGLNNYYISPGNIVALSKHEVCIYNIAGVFRWAGSGTSWTPINDGLIGTTVDSLVYFENALYASTHIRDGIFKSVDGGNRWTPIHRGLPAGHVGALAVSGGKLYLAVCEDNFIDTSLYRLADNRDLWIPVQTAIRAPFIEDNQRKKYYSIYDVAKLEVSDDTFYAFLGAGMNYLLFRWQIGEQHWTHISPDIGLVSDDYVNLTDRGFAVSGENVYVYHEGKFMRSDDKGKTWSKIEAFPRGDVYSREIKSIVVLGKSTYIIDSESGVLRSADHGATWKSFNHGLPGSYSWDLHLVGNTLYATGSKGIFRPNAGQDSWVFVKPFPPYSTYMTTLAVAGSALYVGIGEGGVHRIALDKPDGN